MLFRSLIIVATAWIFWSLAGALPFVLSKSIPSYVDAFFETVSGFTTTGSTILTEIEGLPKGILFWRSLTHWVGGMGVLVFVMVLTSLDEKNSMHLMRAEVPGPEADKLVPKARGTARILYGMYFALTVIEVVFLLAGGMNRTPGIDMSTGSLGQGLSAGNGMALGARLDHAAWHTYVLCGDGEIEEGIIWEAAMTSAHFKLDNLTLIIDHNKLQLGGTTEDVMNIMPIDAKFRDFHWHTITINGYDFTQIKSALQEALAHKGQPTVIIAETVKGKGVDFMENNKEWHNKALDAKDAATALKELGGEG